MDRGKNIALIAVMALILAVPYYAKAEPVRNVKKTPHNMSVSGKGAFVADDETEICIFCHTPHSANPSYPLWNQYSSINSNTYLPYTSSQTLDFTPVGALTDDSISRLCLTCHDGTTAINVLVNPSNKLGRDPEFSAFFGNPPKMGEVWAPGEGPYIGTNLTNMHPINFDYTESDSGDAKIYPISTPRAAGLRFFKSNGSGSAIYIECPTCHDPHVDYDKYEGTRDPAKTRYEPFLRKSNRSSNLCLTCHNK